MIIDKARLQQVQISDLINSRTIILRITLSRYSGLDSTNNLGLRRISWEVMRSKQMKYVKAYEYCIFWSSYGSNVIGPWGTCIQEWTNLRNLWYSRNRWSASRWTHCSHITSADTVVVWASIAIYWQTDRRWLHLQPSCLNRTTPCGDWIVKMIREASPHRRCNCFACSSCSCYCKLVASCRFGYRNNSDWLPVTPLSAADETMTSWIFILS